MNETKVLVVVPAFNAESQIAKVIDGISRSIAGDVKGLLVIDNQSSDGTLRTAIDAIAKNKVRDRFVIQNNSNRGLGGSLKIGFQFAIQRGYSHVLVVHGDNQANPEDFLHVLRDDYFLKYSKVYGSRFMKGADSIGYSRFRRVGNRFLNYVCSILLGREILDLGSGLNLYRTSYLHQDYIYGCRDDLTFNNEILLSEPLPVTSECYVPITWTETDQESNAKVIRQGLRTLQLAMRSRFIWQMRQPSNRSKPDYQSSSYKVIYESKSSE